MGIGLVAVLAHQFAVDADVELAVASGYELEGSDVVTGAVEGLTRHPGGSQGVASMVAVEDLDFQLVVLRHGAPPYSRGWHLFQGWHYEGLGR